MEAVKGFVTDVLGCKCPEELFARIQLNKEPTPQADIPLLFEIHVGGRLIIFGVSARYLSGSADTLTDLAAAGIRARNEGNYNRFRLVVVSDDARADTQLMRLFSELPLADDRVHLHMVRTSDIRGFMDG